MTFFIFGYVLPIACVAAELFRTRRTDLVTIFLWLLPTFLFGWIGAVPVLLWSHYHPPKAA